MYRQALLLWTCLLCGAHAWVSSFRHTFSSDYITTRRSASGNMRMKAGEASQPPRDIKETVQALRQAVQVHGVIITDYNQKT
jgi:hypothetical protein